MSTDKLLPDPEVRQELGLSRQGRDIKYYFAFLPVFLAGAASFLTGAVFLPFSGCLHAITSPPCG